MNLSRTFRFFLGFTGVWLGGAANWSSGAELPAGMPARAAQAAPAGTEVKKPMPLAWDSLEKSIEARDGASVAEFEFTATNPGKEPVSILELRASCSCTIPEMPETPWVILPGAKGAFKATVDYSGKYGRFTKTVTAVTSAGTQFLTMHVNIPDSPEALRMRNQKLAAADRQAVFHGQCASCHSAPAMGKTGADLFQAACGICHTSEHRASMVPDLAVARTPGPRDEAFWRKWINEGKAQTLMPAFGREYGGPLTSEQVESLVTYVTKTYAAQPQSR